MLELFRVPLLVGSRKCWIDATMDGPCGDYEFRVELAHGSTLWVTREGQRHLDKVAFLAAVVADGAGL